MKTSDTISVNPGKVTLGQTESNTANIFRANVIDRNKHTGSVDILAVLCPSVGSGVNELKNYALPLRALFATLLIVAGLTVLQTSSGIQLTAMGVLELVFGSLLAIGFLTRPIMAAAAVYFAIAGALSIRSGQTDITSLCLMFGCGLFCILGSGKYSVDLMLRSAILKYRKRKAARRSSEVLGYKAFHSVKF